MTTAPDPQSAAPNVQPTVEAALAAAWGGAVRLAPGQILEEASGRSQVSRYPVLDAPGHAPASVIVKQVTARPGEQYTPDQPGGVAERFFNEWAALALLNERIAD